VLATFFGVDVFTPVLFLSSIAGLVALFTLKKSRLWRRLGGWRRLRPIAAFWAVVIVLAVGLYGGFQIWYRCYGEDGAPWYVHVLAVLAFLGCLVALGDRGHNFIDRKAVTPFFDSVDLQRAGSRKAFTPVGVLDTICSDGVPRMEFSPDGRRLYVTRPGAFTEIWDAETAQTLSTLEGSDALDREYPLFLWFSPDSSIVMSQRVPAHEEFPGRPALLWDAETGGKLPNLEGIAERSSLTLSPDGEHILAEDENSVYGLWNPKTGQRVLTLDDSQYASSMEFLHDGDRIASVGDGQIREWDARTGECLRTLDWPSQHGFSMEWLSSDGNRLLTLTQNTLGLWDVDSGSLISSLRAADTPGIDEMLSGKEADAMSTWSLHAPQFSPDGRRVLWQIPRTGTVMLWDPEADRWLQTLRSRESIISTSFSPDGERVLWHGNAMLMIWSVDTGECLHSFVPRRLWDMVRWVWSDDGTKVVCAGKNGQLSLWAYPV